MKKFLLPLAFVLLLVGAACDGEIDPEALVESASNAAEEVVDSVTEQLSEPTSEESDEHNELQIKGCDPAATVNIPASTEPMVTVRFVNASGSDLIGEWQDTSQTTVENFQLADGEYRDFQGMSENYKLTVADMDDDTNKSEYVATAGNTQCKGVYHHFDYKGEAQPINWADLTEYYHACNSVVMQSPIDLTGATAADLENIHFEYGETAVNILNNGHTIQVDGITNNQITIDGTTYKLLQLHFHAPSEHTVAGEPYPIEMHLVHKSDDGRFAVVGVLIDEGTEENTAFAPVWAHLPGVETGGVINNTGKNVNVADLLPTEQLVFRYTGSLTTPPCTEGILWSVITTPVQMSPEQIDAFASIFKEGINRPVQPVNEQGLQLDETP